MWKLFNLFLNGRDQRNFLRQEVLPLLRTWESEGLLAGFNYSFYADHIALRVHVAQKENLEQFQADLRSLSCRTEGPNDYSEGEAVTKGYELGSRLAVEFHRLVQEGWFSDEDARDRETRFHMFHNLHNGLGLTYEDEAWSYIQGLSTLAAKHEQEPIFTGNQLSEAVKDILEACRKHGLC